MSLADASRNQQPEDRPKLPFAMVLTVYQRLIAAVLLSLGLLEWASILGIQTELLPELLALQQSAQAAFLVFAVVDLVAAVGLWLTSAWGVAIWIFCTVARLVIHIGFAQTFGATPIASALQAGSIVIYVIFSVLAAREKKAAETRRRARRRQVATGADRI
jgi:hypothetical protein